ncbi:hypothetical protein D9619_009871 [Psilocybe cf. subviscida]|uniref:O-methyltransferase family 3 protein n=1 Tax=Psilocybe cf. subviscida TaxID=2480587 RepID=A0A8H5BLB2_9AGAR|nr:hypothetical protein D9619_009871 [Psilocybe cf. subviscida]
MAGRQTYKTTNIDDWKRSDDYHNSFLIPKDDVLDAVVKNNHAQGLPDIAVSAAQGRFLNLLAKTQKAKRILEVGTLGGYSTIWLARALPEDGKLVTLELDETHAKIATENVKNAGFADKVEVIVGPAAESLKRLSPEPPFDLAFIDADKEGNLTYFIEAKRLLKSGGAIIVDNVVRKGKVADPAEQSASIDGVRRLLTAIKDDDEVEATTIATVGDKGYDGFLYAFKK